MKMNTMKRMQHRLEAIGSSERRAQAPWSWWRSAMSFALGATATATVLLLLDANRAQNPPVARNSSPPAVQAAATDDETSNSPKDLSREELDRYVQWVQQMNAQTRNMAGGDDLLAAMGGLPIRGAGGLAGVPASGHDPLFPLRSGVPGSHAPMGGR